MSKMAPALLSWLLLGACVPAVDDDLATVERPRLLAIQATPAEALPGATATFAALVAAPGEGNHRAVEWVLCLDQKPLTELGPVSPACLDPAAGASIVQPIGRGDEVMSEVPRDACSLFGPNPPPPENPGEPGGRPADPDPTGGYYQPVIAAIGGADQTLGAIRLNCGVPGLTPEQHVDFGTRYRVNENPRVDVLRTEDGAVVAPDDSENAPIEIGAGSATILEAEWASCPREAVCGDGICGEREDATSCAEDCPAGASRGCTGAETYAWYDAALGEIVDRRESIVISWYATAGEFEHRKTGVSETDADEPRTRTTWTSPSKPGDYRLWLVIRDDRGGVSWRSYRVSIR
jgi:hypothetical protein